MSETKLEVKTVYDSEKFRKVCEIFAMCNSDFFFFEKQK